MDAGINPLLSIVTATYNNAKQLPRFFDSIINQSYQNWELLIVNDGSTDESLEICQAYALRDKRIKVFSQKNQGQASARNLSLEEIKGSYIAFIDGDDAIKRDTYKSAIELLVSSPCCDIVAFPIEWINRRERFTTYTESCPIISQEDMFDALLKTGKIRFLLTDKIYKAHLLRGLKFEPKVYFDDNLMLCQILLRSKGVCFSTYGAYEYHQEEFEEGKNNWTEYKEHSQIVVNVKMAEALRSVYPTMPTQRMLFNLRVCNQVISQLRHASSKHPTVLYGKPYIKNIYWSDIWRAKISYRDKLKSILLKIWARLV